jgi:hypothetical protein
MVITREGAEPKPRRRKKEVITESITAESQTRTEKENFLICDDCKHNTIAYDPSMDGTCLCGCH